MNKKTKWSYCIGATGRDMAYTLVSMFLLNYIQYTMKLTVPQYATISAIVVICLIWDAFNDPMMGIIIENAHLKSGKFKPWIMLGVLLSATDIICMFTIRPSGWGYVVFFGISYLLWGMTYTMNDIAYWGMLPSLTSDAKERNALITIQGIFICIGQFTVAGLLPDLVAGNAVNTYKIAAIVIALLFIGFQVLTCVGVTESPRVENKNALSFADMFRIFKRNDQLVAAGIALLLFQVGNGLLIMIGMNFFYFEFGYTEGGTLIFLFTVMFGLGTLVSEASYAAIASKFSRKQIMTVSMILIIVGYTMLMLIGYVLPKNVILLNVIGFIIFLSQGAFNMVMIVMINNTIEYDEVNYGERHDSTISAIRSFAVKLASAIDQGAVALILIISGIYTISQNISDLEIQKGKGELMQDAVLTKAEGYIAMATSGQKLILRFGIVLVPIITITTAYVLLRRKYIIDEDKYKELTAEIESRKAQK